MTILIVDDHEHIRRLLKEWLKEEFPRCGFLEAACAKEAISYCCCEESPDLVIMDINLPEIDGINATMQIKNIQPDIPVVVLTIHGNGVYREAALKAGASGYVVKDKLHEDLIPLLAGLLQKQDHIRR
jgi:two-component system, NarL family, invasion response regulator UvrY